MNNGTSISPKDSTFEIVPLTKCTRLKQIVRSPRAIAELILGDLNPVKILTTRIGLHSQLSVEYSGYSNFR